MDKNDNVDFNIQNYSIDDLEYFFRLDEVPNYDKQTIEKHANEVQSQLLNGGTFDPSLKKGFQYFIQQGKEKLLNSKRPMDIYEETPLSRTALVPDKEHAIESPPQTSYIYADPSAFYQGKMNPLNTRVLTRILNIDTRFRSNLEENSANFLINLPIKFYKVVSMKVTAFELPIGFYGISKSFGNNFFTIGIETYTAPTTTETSETVITIADGNYEDAEFIAGLNEAVDTNNPDESHHSPTTTETSETVFTIADGNYEDAEFIAELNEAVDTNNPDESHHSPTTTETSETVFTIADGNYTDAELITALNEAVGSNNPQYANPYSAITFSLDPISNKVTALSNPLMQNGIPNLANFSLHFNKTKNGDPDNTPLSSKLGYNIGFTKGSYKGETDYLSESLIDPRSIKYLFLVVDDFQNNVSNNSFVSAFENSFLDNNILARVSLKVKDSDNALKVIRNDELLSEPRQYFGPVDLQKIQVRLQDEYGRVVNMNKTNFSFCITLEQLYKL
jgi:hypothetical protein